MGWLQDLFGKSLNPEEFERVRCDRCDGTGHPPTGYSGLHSEYRNYGIPCGKCHGKGYLMVKREAEVLRDAPGPRRDAVTDSATSVAEDALGERLPPESPDTVTPPAAPEAPEGFVTQ